MENVQLTIADLGSIHSIIDAACTRGAFKAAEMKQIGEVYDKLTAFLKQVQAHQEQEATQASQGETNA
jgi:hypothetical protein